MLFGQSTGRGTSAASYLCGYLGLGYPGRRWGPELALGACVFSVGKSPDREVGFASGRAQNEWYLRLGTLALSVASYPLLTCFFPFARLQAWHET